MLKEQKQASKMQNSKLREGKCLSRSILRKLDRHLSPTQLDSTLNTEVNGNPVGNLVNKSSIVNNSNNLELNNVHGEGNESLKIGNNVVHQIKDNNINSTYIDVSLESSIGSHEFFFKDNKELDEKSKIYRVKKGAASIDQLDKVSIDSPLILIPTGKTEIVDIKNKYIDSENINIKRITEDNDQSFYNRPGMSLIASRPTFSDQFLVAKPCSSHQKVVWFCDTYFGKTWDYKTKANSSTGQIKENSITSTFNDSNIFTFVTALFCILLLLLTRMLGSLVLQENSVNISDIFSISLFTILSSGSLKKSVPSYLVHYILASIGFILFSIFENIEKLITFISSGLYVNLIKDTKLDISVKDMELFQNYIKTLMTFKGFYVLKYPAWFVQLFCKNNRIKVYKGIMTLTTKLYKIIFYFIPFMLQPIEKHDIQNIHLKNINKNFSYTEFQRRKVKKLYNYKSAGKNDLSTFLPLYIRNELPFIEAKFNKSGNPIRLLIDTGCRFNLLNIKDLNRIELTEKDSLPRFSHNLQLQGHSGKSVKIEPLGVLIPLDFETETPLEYIRITMPFLIENERTSVNIIGYDYIRELFVHFSRGYNYLEISVPKQIRLPEEWKTITEYFYKGTLRSVTVYEQASYANEYEIMDLIENKKIEFKLPGFEKYTGCIFMSHIEMNYREKMIINWNVITHLHKGVPIFESEEFINIIHSYGYLDFFAITFPCQECNQRCNENNLSAATEGIFMRNELDLKINHLSEEILNNDAKWDRLSNIIDYYNNETASIDDNPELSNETKAKGKNIEDFSKSFNLDILFGNTHDDPCISVNDLIGLDFPNVQLYSEGNLINLNDENDNPIIYNKKEIVIDNRSKASDETSRKHVNDSNTNVRMSNNTSDEVNNLINFDQEIENPLVGLQKGDIKCKTFNISDERVEGGKNQGLNLNNSIVLNETSDEAFIKGKHVFIEPKRVKKEIIIDETRTATIKGEKIVYVTHKYAKEILGKGTVEKPLLDYGPEENVNINEGGKSTTENYRMDNLGIYDHDNVLDLIKVDPMEHGRYLDVKHLKQSCLEIQVRDLAGKCLICTLECFCTQNKKAILNMKKRGLRLKYGKERNHTQKRSVYKRGEVTFLILESLKELKYHLGFLSEIIYNLISRSKRYNSFRLGNIIHLNHYNEMITCHMLRYFQNCGWPPQTHFLRTFQSVETATASHHLEYNQDEDIHIGKLLMENQTIGLPADIGVQGEVKYIHDESDVHQNDITELLKESNPDYFHIMEKALEAFPQALIKSLDDFGAILHPSFKLEIKLTDNSLGALPRHKPFPCSNHYARVVDKLVGYWCKIELAEESDNKDWASRLLIIRKKISDRQYKTIRAEVEANSTYQFKSDNIDELYSIDCEFLSIKSLQSIYRIVLDSRDLNRITCPILGISQNPETTLYSIMINMNNLSQESLAHITLESLHNSDPYKDEAKYLNPQVSDETLAELTRMINELPDRKDQRYYYSSIDISSAHTSVKLVDEASKLLNFITPSLRLFKFRRSAFGLKGISTQFNSILIMILYDLVCMALVVIYADDILIASVNKKTHIIIVITILQRFARHGIRISINKCTIGVKKFRYIGFLFNETGISLSPERVSGITSFPPPQDKKGVMRLVGMLNFISKWIPQYSYNLHPITDLLKGDGFHWGEEQQKAFDNIKKIIGSDLKLNYVPHDETLTLYVDSSGIAGGAVLFAGEAGTASYRPILYMSKKYDLATIKSSSALEAECINLVYSIEKVKFFTSLPRKIKVVTDAKSIIFLLFGSRKTKNAKLARLAGKISEYLVDFEVVYSPPNIPEMVIADCLSRQHSSSEYNYPSNICKAISKKDISLPKEGVYNFEELSKLVDYNDFVQIPKDFINHLSPEPNCPEINILGEDQIIPELHSTHNVMILSSIKELSDENIIQEQAKDGYLKEILKEFPLENSLTDTEYNNFKMNKGIIYIKENNVFKLYIPDSLLNTLVGAAHIMFGHRGQKSLIELMELKYYHPKLRDYITHLVKACHLCLLCSPDSRKKAPIDGFKVCTYPNEVWSIDYFKMEKFNNWQYILIIVDLFSGYTILHKAKSEKGTSTIEGLKRAFLHLAIPKEIRSDRAMGLLGSKEVINLLKKFNISQYRFPAYYSKHNPRVERYIKTIRGLFKFYKASNDPTTRFDWPSILEEVNILLNSIPRKLKAQGTTKYLSSFEMYFNRKSNFLSLPADLSKFDEYQANPDNTVQMQEFVTEAITTLKQEYATAHNRKSREDIIQPGDFFLIKDKSAPKAGEVAIKNRTLYKRKVYICKQVLGRALVGESLWDGSVVFANLDNIKVYLSRSAYFSDLPPEIKKHVGSEFNATIDMRVRRQLIEKLRNLNMFYKETKDAVIDFVSEHSITLGSSKDNVSITGIEVPPVGSHPNPSKVAEVPGVGPPSVQAVPPPTPDKDHLSTETNLSNFSEFTKALTLSRSDLVENDEFKDNTDGSGIQVETKLDTISEEEDDYAAPSDITSQIKKAGENIIRVARPQRVKNVPKKFKDHVLSWVPGSSKNS